MWIFSGFHNIMKIDQRLTILLLYSFSSFHWMTYKSYFFKYSSFCLFWVFWGVWKCYSIYCCQCWKWHLGSETVPSATLSLKLRLMLVINNDFLFFMQVEIFARISEGPSGTKGYRAKIHKFCLRFPMLPNFVPPAMHGY